ncbi:glycosyltransferase involved in cell wall biosynthesis [Salinibacter ruber]|uniref:glycosyltransferase family 4 protein n=1 Tax=Salinibacter ruber TaxID=146919 RepID=UPI001ABA9FAA|nr:glycosyltransferase family 4 protein [Salinibacter ruber]MCS3650122.1 glycosyltransferase involved in cell wall biosynthesis [Salinibacter ruber]MCS3653376.1 glycosyltransferase involved in cell wall biosynthesis [Salinibacter ruber]
MKVVFAWPTISGYMAACWRALAGQSGVDPFVLAFEAGQSTAFNDGLMEGIPSRLLGPDECHDTRRVRDLVVEQNPDIVVLSGWFHPPYRRLPFRRALRDARFVMGMDTPWQGTGRQRLGRWVLRPFVQRMDRVVVTGERSWQYARRLGVAPERIVRGLYGVDETTLGPLWEQRRANGWPRRFLFVGRFADEKAVDVLVEGYARYRDASDDPWPLVCCGKGPMADRLDRQPGIDNRGFVQPGDMEGIWAEAGAFVLPSRFDPWPLALVEAATSGLPVVCSDACGSAVEIVRNGYNGVRVPDEDSGALSRAFRQIQRRYDDLPEWGRRAQRFAAPHSAERWGERWARLLRTLE